MIYYSCNDGYSLVGPRKQLCVEGVGWDPPEMPTCVIGELYCSQSGKLAERVFPRCCCCKWEEINAGTNAREPAPIFLRIILVLDVHIWR